MLKQRLEGSPFNDPRLIKTIIEDFEREVSF
jgi:hypothetical protein